MNVRAMISRLILCLCGVLLVSSAGAESVIVATPQQGVGISVDVFDHPEASTGKPSSTSLVRFTLPAFYIPSVQSFKGKVYMFWSNNYDQKHIYFSTSTEGKNWSAAQPISVDSVLGDVSVSVFKQKLVLTFSDPQSRLKTISSVDGIAWSQASFINTGHKAVNNKPVVYNGQLFVLYSENSGKAIYYVSSNDGLAWSRENLGFQEGADSILTMVPVVYNGKLWVYYAFENGAMFARTYDRAGQWGARQELAGITNQAPKGFLNSATMIGERVFISSSANTFYSDDGLHWAPYFAKRFTGNAGFVYPSGLGVSYAITANDLTTDNPQLPADLATGLSHTDYATFAWRSFIALNNAANTPLPANRGVGNPASSFADSGKLPQSSSPLLWQTFAHRTELFPALGKNAVGGPTRPFGSSPQYSYIDFPNGAPLAAGASFAHYNNLDEATQIGQNAIFFPVNPPQAAMKGSNYTPSNDSQILFEAKANPVVYAYAKSLSRYPDHIVLPDGAVEVKAAWRKLADIPTAQRARYYTATVVTYHGDDKAPVAYNEEYALVALHIIHKTANYPTFIFATFEQEDALTLPDKSPSGLYYIANYNNIAYSKSPNNDPAPIARFSDGNTIHTVTLPKGKIADRNQNPPIYSGSNGIPEGQAGPIRVVQPQTIFSEVTAVNNQVKQLMDGSSEFNNSVWKHYRLKGVQAIPSSTETDPDYYLANIMLESSRPGIQLFRGTNIFPVPKDNTLTNMRTMANIKVPDFDHSTQSQTMGGCMGCHGASQSVLKQGFSFLFDAINTKGTTGFSNPETIGLPDPRTQQQRALKYSLGFQGKGVVENTGN
ncbi:sialidase family protein [Pseudomonas sp. MWU13-2105]|uniref:sialidase family protein n=1 Tax=Pseudomonas sp. MWU13-2105 TaxID=2935074 RepID=UPI00200BE268|nr:sialidase family protein [Pseudomonas sp. MWU13-2105]